MKIVLPEKVAYIIDTLTQHGFEAYAVGGCVRDIPAYHRYWDPAWNGYGDDRP